MNFKMMVSAMAMVTLPVLANAQTPSDARSARIDQRQENQARRIDQGVKSGELNARETARMQKGQQHVQNMEDRARADGKITHGEARRIERAQDVQSARIYTQKHDNQKAFK